MRNVSAEKEKAIRAAAEALVAEGNDSPTNDEVRAKLGGGSIADISPVMRKWRELQKQQAGIRLAIPPAISQAGERFVTQLWGAADAEAGKALDALQAEHEEQTQATAAERDEALGEIARLEASARKLRDELSALQTQSSDYERQLDALSQANQALALERERAVAQNEAAQESQAQLLAQLNESQTNYKDLQKELLALARTGKKKSSKK